MSDEIDGKILFAGLARDASAHLAAVFSNIDRMGACFRQKAHIFLENDSADHTLAILEAFQKARPDTLVENFNGLASKKPVRTVRLAQLRSHYLSVACAQFADYDFLVTMDCDSANTARIDTTSFRRAIEFLKSDPECAAVFPNQDGVYYDLWALRCDGWRPTDVWEDALDHYVTKGGTDEEIFDEHVAPSIRTLSRHDAPISVRSAYGGLGIYKMSSVLKNARRSTGHKVKTLPTTLGVREVGWGVCEHVDFHQGFVDNGESLYILPFLVNRQTPGYFEALNGCITKSVWRNYLFELSELNRGG